MEDPFSPSNRHFDNYRDTPPHLELYSRVTEWVSKAFGTLYLGLGNNARSSNF
ncbi:hypothetical protein CC2G_002929 [Coprinopsis cinerea AmutBmut pab1-1]|nr:hypothetical protein CC2G_002929 [Coprinopsis cinerea AmutBmut pab1-1]